MVLVPGSPTPDERSQMQQRFGTAALRPSTVAPLGQPGLFPSLGLRAGALRQVQYTHHRAVFLVAAGVTHFFPPLEPGAPAVLTGLRAVPLPVDGAPGRWAELAARDLAPLLLLLLHLQRPSALPDAQARETLAVLERLAGHVGRGSQDLALSTVARTPAEMARLLEQTLDRTPHVDAVAKERLPLAQVAREVAAGASGPRTDHLALAERTWAHDGRAGGATRELSLLRLQAGHTRYHFERQLAREVVDGMEIT